MSESLLDARRLDKRYPSGPRTIEVLRSLDLQLPAGQALAIVGESGVGKSTLLHILGGLDRPDGGSLRFRGDELLTADSRRLAEYRNRHIGFVFQMHHLLPEFSARENVEMPFRIGRRSAGCREEALEMLDRMGLAERADHVPAALSGGEQQRVAIARAVVARPALVLADEPTGNLDPQTGGRVFNVLRELQRERSFAMVLATHSERLARGCDRVLRLEDGVLRPLEGAAATAYFKGQDG